MRCIWNEEKNRINRRKHGGSFEEAKTVFDDPLAVSIFDHEHSITEQRWLTIGMSSQGQLWVVVHTHLVINGEDLVRIISARRPTAHERKSYEED